MIPFELSNKNNKHMKKTKLTYVVNAKKAFLFASDIETLSDSFCHVHMVLPDTHLNTKAYGILHVMTVSNPTITVG